MAGSFTSDDQLLDIPGTRTIWFTDALIGAAQVLTPRSTVPT